ncbi:hypothetical protein B0H17DRAFT_1215052 [Mycena rosella]|uniref:MYND-type domain-containing protein n=1 Tax=Mycena rosella TaxID=1033263 RepID=A0AAD7G044_MYCRO|nr:hypothetical protein B0H17DRAFT_1215052 [Mycena rosella]
MRNLKKAPCSFSTFLSISPEAAADFVASAIGDAGSGSAPRYCAQCVFGALHVVYPKDTVDAASEFPTESAVAEDGVADLHPAVRMQRLQRKHFHAFWSALIRFLTVVRDESQEIRFLFKFAGCFTCFAAPLNPHVAQFHRIAEVLYPDIEDSDGTFVMVAQNMHNRRWPTSTKDIIPYGGKITTQMFLRWANYTEDIAFTTFGILGHMVKICGTLIIGDMTANAELGDVFISTGWRMCRDATKALCNPHDDSEYSDRLAVAAEFRQRATFAASFLESATALAPEIFAALIAGREAKTVQLLSLILEVCHAYSISSDPTLDAQFKGFDWTIFLRWARQILADHPELQPLLGKLHRDIVASQRTIEDPLDTVYHVLAAAKSRARCHAPRCGQSLASAAATWKCCGACRVVAYCGKPCQTRAWKSGPHPHKRICAHITALVDKGGGLDDRDAFVRNCRVTNVSAEEALKVVKWEFNPVEAPPLNDDEESFANADGAAEFDALYWQLHPNEHPAAAECWERTGSYWERPSLD